MSMWWFENPVLDWRDPNVRDFCDQLCDAYWERVSLLDIWQALGLRPADLPIHDQVSLTWRRVLDELAKRALLKNLAEYVLKDSSVAGFHGRFREVLYPAAEDDPGFARHRRLEAERDELEALEEKLERQGQDVSPVVQRLEEIQKELKLGAPLGKGDVLSDGRYRLEKRIGRGGFASVWRAVDQKEGGRVAVKILDSRHCEERRPGERFYRGARVMAGLRHPNIVEVLATNGLHQGHKFFVMEFLEGGDLSKAFRRRNWEPEEVLDVIERVAEALVEVHQNQLVHRDIKPANMLLTKDGTPKLTDFDLVRAADTSGGTRTGALGTVVFAAPEVVKDASRATPAADVYGLAMSVVAGIRGETPGLSEAYNPELLLEKLPVEDAVRELLSDSLALDPHARPQDAGVWLERLKETKNGLELPLRALRRKVSLDPADLASRIHLAEGYFAAGRVSEAAQEFWKAATLLKDANRIDDYIKVAERLVFVDPSRLDVVQELARIYIQRGDTKRGLAKLQVCFKADPGNIDTLEMLVQGFIELGSVPKAIFIYKKLIQAYQNSGKKAEVEQALRQVLRLDPNDEEARAMLAQASPGHPLITPWVRSNTEESDSLLITKILTEADVYIKYGLKDKALEHLQRVFEVDPDNIPTYRKQCDLYLSIGDSVRAAEALANIVGIYGRTGDVVRKERALAELVDIAPGHPLASGQKSPKETKDTSD